ncbi:FAD/NAD(P)-binding protein [Microbacterium gubbeenense]|uniref:FAD/NAD(P)-binding protein n=4 Tax=Microbacterium gubbeenense TaxID=159896 RepID=UPI0003F95233|nr:FAD/NAD(P)-binding protein [Microbacterium gubbeenense]
MDPRNPPAHPITVGNALDGAGMASDDRCARVVVAGAGPAALMLLERITANHAAESPGRRLRIDLVDPHEPGGGRIWRRDQSPLLKLNTLVGDNTIFTDDSCVIGGPIAPGLALVDWLGEIVAGRVDRPDWWDDALESEARGVTQDSFPTRRLNNAYLSWAYGEVLRRAAPTVSIAWHRDRVAQVDAPSSEEPAAVILQSGERLEADVVVYAIGHNGSAPSPESAGLAEFAATHGLGYLGPAFTAEADLGWVRPGQDVIVRGMGLAAVDLVVLLTEGRGGRYVADGDRLRYLPSGEEPVLHLGSRRGVPYRSKITSRLAGDPTALEFLGDAFHERIARTERPIDFDRDVWPLFVAEIIAGHFRELFTAHPERVRGSWTDFLALLRGVLEAPDGFRSDAYRDLVAAHVASPDRFDFAAFDRPLEGTGATGSAADDDEALQSRVRDHIRVDLDLRTKQHNSQTQGMFFAALFGFLSINEVPKDRWTARSRTLAIPRAFKAFFSYLASGPPGHRLEELLALSEAGVVRFLGGRIRLETDHERGAFTASGEAVDASGRTVRASVVASALIDAWLPEPSAAASDNPLLRGVIESGRARELTVSDDEHTGTTGELVVNDDGSLPESPREFAVGPFTSVLGGAFSRPGVNGLPFRHHDRVARAILTALGEWASGSGSSRSGLGRGTDPAGARALRHTIDA